MFIFVIGRGLPSELNPLNGIFEFDQAKALEKVGHKIVYISLDFRSIRRFRRFGFFSLKKDNIECFEVSFPFGNIEYRILNFLARKIVGFATIILKKRYGKPDLVHAHFLQIASLSVTFKAKYQVPLVVTEHSTLLNANTISKRLYILGKRVYNYSDLIIAVSNSLQKKLQFHFGVTSIVVNNLVDSEIFGYNNSVNRYSIKSEFSFVSVGALINNKGFDLLIKAFSNAGFSKNVKLKIIGTGILLDKLKKDVQKYKLERQVDFLGMKKRSEILQEFLKSNAFVLSSRVETFGVVFIEAMLAGLPVVATISGGPEEFVNESNGILVPVEDVDRLTKALILMHDTYHLYNHETISKNTILLFSPMTIASKLTTLYNTMFNKRGI